MKASTQYTDLVGTAAADVSDLTTKNNTLEEVANEFGIDQTRFKVVGLSIYGKEKQSVAFICEDLSKSTPDNPHMVKLYIEDDDKLDLILKRLHIVLYNKYDNKYPSIDNYEELNLKDFIDEEE